MTEIQLFVLTLLAFLIAGLISNRFSASLLFFSAIILCYVLDLLSLELLLNNYTNHSLVILVLLIVISIAVEKTRLIAWISRKISHGSLLSATAKLGLSSALLSSFTNNTAVVATLIAAVKDNTKYPPSKLLLPLSYTAILGGTLTLIGTSTNLIVNGFIQQMGEPGLSFFAFTGIGLACLASGLVVIIIGSKFLPEQKDEENEYSEFYLEAKVLAHSPFVGKTIEENGLRDLKSLYLAEIIRQNQRIVAVSPEEKLQTNDILLFVGDISRVNILRQFQGLRLPDNSQRGSASGHLVEVVVSHSSSLVGQTVKQARFRETFDAAVIAIRRGNSKLAGGLGEIKLLPGDSLILAPGSAFCQDRTLTQKNFVYISGLEVRQQLNRWQTFFVLTGLITALASAMLGFISLIKVLILLLLLFIMTGTIKLHEIRRRFPTGLIVLVGSAMSLAHLMLSTGVADLLAQHLMSLLEGYGAFGTFVAIYLFTLLMTEIITNNAAASLAFPIAYSLSQSLDVNYMPFIMAVIFGASASFISPYGYQTNLMVYSAGNYQFKDYIRLGLPLSITYSLTVIFCIPWIFPF